MTDTQIPKTLPVGHNCRYYPQGDTSREPVAAIVTGTSKIGQLDVTIFNLNAHNSQPRSGVRHRDDPYHVDHPAYGRENGTWDFLESRVVYQTALPTGKTIEIAPATDGECECEEPLSLKQKTSIARVGCEIDAAFLGSVSPESANTLLAKLYAQHGKGHSKTIAGEMAKATGKKWSYQRVNTTLRSLKNQGKLAPCQAEA